MDDITPLQQASKEMMAAEAHLFENRPATQWLRIQPQGTGGTFGFRGENPSRDAVVNYHLGAGGDRRRDASRSPTSPARRSARTRCRRSRASTGSSGT